MKVTLKGFRCHLDTCYEFNDNLTLISGPSGVGKSTIFQAIFWCLYGNLKGIYDHTGTVTRCSVLLELGNCTIYRQGKPNLLKFNYKSSNSTDSTNEIFEDKVAQDLIEREFGPKNVWKACSYIEQGSKCELITCANPDRMDILNCLSFSNDNPEDCIEKIDEEIKNVQKELHGAQVSYSTESELLVKQLSSRPLSQHVASDQIAVLKNYIENRKKEVSDLSQKRVEQGRILGIYTTLIEELKVKESIPEVVISLPILNEVEIVNKLDLSKTTISKLGNSRIEQFRLKSLFDRLKVEILEVFSDLDVLLKRPVTESTDDLNYLNFLLNDKSNRLGLLNSKKLEQYSLRNLKNTLTETIKSKEQKLIPPTLNLQDLSNRIDFLQRSLTEEKRKKEIYDRTRIAYDQIDIVVDRNITLESIFEAKNKERSRAEHLFLANNLQVEYSTSAIAIEIERLRKELELAPKIQFNLDLYKKIEENKNELSKIPVNPVVTTEMFNQANNKYNEMKRGTESLSCPHCGKSVRYCNSVLLTTDVAPITPEQLQIAYQEVVTLYNILQNQTKFSEISRVIENLSNQIIPNLPIKLINVQEVSKKITQLERIIIIPEVEISSNILSLKYEKQELGKTLELNKSGNFDISKSELELKELISIYQVEFGNVKIYSELTQEITELNKRLLSIILIDNFDDEILRLENECSNLKLKIDEVTHYNKVKVKKETLSFKKIELENVEKSLILDIDFQYSQAVAEQEFLNTQLLNLEKWKEQERRKLAITNLKEKISKIVILPNIENMYLQVEKDLQDALLLLTNSEYAYEVAEKQKSIELKRKEVADRHKDCMSLQSLRTTAIAVECAQIQSTVDAINFSINEILALIFESPITVCLKLYKELKTGHKENGKFGKIKPQVNLSVFYKGVEYDSISNLSGGEGDRVSFALLLSLNRLSASPFIFLDEAFSSLNDDLRTACIEAVRTTICGTKQVICVNHEDIEGNYDSVIRIGD